MHSKLLGLSLITGLMSATAFAEPPIQPGDTLESLSKVKVMTTVNGQAGSIQDLVASGQIRIVDANQVASASTQNTSESVSPASTMQAPMQQATPEQQDVNSTAQMIEPPLDQSSDPAHAQAAAVAPENTPAIQPDAELAAQQAEQVVGQEVATQAPITSTNNAPMLSSSAQTPVNAGDGTQTDVTAEAVAAAPVNKADINMDTEALAAAPELDQSNDAIQAAPEMPNTDAPVNASPEVPMADSTEN
ncbi:hypothetical protein H0S58_00800 [Acinetobacter sp. TTH0-4]|uniref:hypothetical protein n=1 Tax=Acinetobacter sp. TTH0-4 TaxID=1646498 RepID=UPI00189F5A42|nr:hypothetical protein [Acinetobacter sp. TTH0-4]QPF38119.1 hypothetical protein H0S58_00800 [Acinetobacter sp. TTH0-4]